MISASSLKRDCRYPVVLDRIPPRTAQEKTREANKRASADRGTIFHLAVQRWCETGHLSREVEDVEIQGWIDLLAAQWAPPAGMEAEVTWGLTMDGAYRDVLQPEPHVYQAADGSPLLTAGTADGVWTGNVEERVIYVVDWKSGKWPVEPARTNLQVNAAGIALTVKEFALSYIPGIYYTRDGAFDWGEPVRLNSPEWKARLADVQEAALMDETPQAGPHCNQCWSKSKCPAYRP